MALNRIACPECGAGLKSPTGFAVGQTVCCPKCETYFAVEESAEEATEQESKPQKAKPVAAKAGNAATKTAKKPVKAAAVTDDDEDDDDETTTKKKKKKEKTYANSPLRYAVLGVLLVVMGVLGYFLWKKNQDEKETANQEPPTNPNPNRGTPPGVLPGGPGGPGGPGRVPPGPGGVVVGDGGFVPPGGPGGFVPPGGPGGIPPGGPGGFVPPGGPGGVRPGGPGKGPGSGPPPITNPGGGGSPFGDLVGGEPLTPAEADMLKKAFQAKIIGTWVADLGDGKPVELTYKADGTMTETQGGKTTTGKWSVTGIDGRRGLLVQRTGFGTSGAERVTFEDDEMQHPVVAFSVVGVFRKK